MKKTFQSIIVIASIVIITGCGGGSSGSGSGDTVSSGGTSGGASNANIALIPFNNTAINLPDLDPEYQSFCPNLTRSLQNIIPVDINKDGRMDLVLSLWCSPVTDRSYYSGPTPNRVLVLLQNSQGNFTNGSKQVFGVDAVQTGGSSEYYVLGDFNNDGYTYIVFSQHREDGRNKDGANRSTLWSPSMSMMSLGNGTYNLTQIGIGPGGEGASLALIDNSLGGQDVLTLSFSAPASVWRFSSSTGWTEIPGFDWSSGSSGIQFFSRNTLGTGSTTAIKNYTSNSKIGVQLYRNLNGLWTTGVDYSYSASIINKIDWGATQASFASMVRINGEDFVDPSFGTSCKIRRLPTSSPEVLTVFNANKIVGGYTGQVITYGLTPLQEYNKIFSFSSSGDNLIQNEILIKNEITGRTQSNRMACMDINGDGHDDIVLYTSRNNQTPIIYLNDKAGSFDLVSSASYPASPDYGRNGLSNYILADMDSDGINDLIYFPIVGTGGFPIQIKIHKGLRNISSTDIVK